jgi:hypothetical protein
MNKTAAGLKIVAIVLNSLFLVFLVLLSISNPPDGSDLALAIIIYIYPVMNLLALILSRKILTGRQGAVVSTLSIIFGVAVLLILVFVISKSGMPEPLGMRAFVLIWFLAPLISCLAILLLRANAKKGASLGEAITCPHCGGEISV